MKGGLLGHQAAGKAPKARRRWINQLARLRQDAGVRDHGKARRQRQPSFQNGLGEQQEFGQSFGNVIFGALDARGAFRRDEHDARQRRLALGEHPCCIRQQASGVAGARQHLNATTFQRRAHPRRGRSFDGACHQERSGRGELDRRKPDAAPDHVIEKIVDALARAEQRLSVGLFEDQAIDRSDPATVLVI